MSSPQDVDKAVSTPTFFQNQDQFWKMLCYLFTTHEEKYVWELIQVDTFRTIIEQLTVVMENCDQYSTIKSNKDLLYHVYVAALKRIRGGRTVSEFHAYEKFPVLAGFLYLYKQLFHLKMNMPLFAQIPD